MIGMPSLQGLVGLPLMLTPAHNKNVIGTLYGNIRTHMDLPKFIDLVLEGGYMDLGKLITKKFKLEEINDVFDAMTKHQIMGRWVCAFA
jgi:Zn-dependent alcohol dehydrogenase